MNSSVFVENCLENKIECKTILKKNHIVAKFSRSNPRGIPNPDSHRVALLGVPICWYSQTWIFSDSEPTYHYMCLVEWKGRQLENIGHKPRLRPYCDRNAPFFAQKRGKTRVFQIYFTFLVMPLFDTALLFWSNHNYGFILGDFWAISRYLTLPEFSH